MQRDLCLLLAPLWVFGHADLVYGMFLVSAHAFLPHGFRPQLGLHPYSRCTDHLGYLIQASCQTFCFATASCWVHPWYAHTAPRRTSHNPTVHGRQYTMVWCRTMLRKHRVLLTGGNFALLPATVWGCPAQGKKQKTWGQLCAGLDGWTAPVLGAAGCCESCSA